MSIKACLLAAVRHMLIPIARVLIRNGVPYGDFEEVARHAFAKAGQSVIGERGLQLTLSRLSLLTGLPRREMRRVMDRPPQITQLSLSDSNAAARVLHAWHTKSPFVLVPIGVPMDLEYEAADSNTTFVGLVKAHVPDADPSDVLSELIASGSVKQDERGFLHPTSRTFVTGDLSEDQIKYAARAARRFLDTLDVNLTKDGRRTGRFERTVVADKGVPVRCYTDFVSYVRATMQQTLEDIDEWITANALSADSSEPVFWTGVGMYHWLEQEEDFELTLKELLLEEVNQGQNHERDHREAAH
jgi:hypothetical protein